MKKRLFYFLIAAIIIFSVFAGIMIWRYENLKGITKFHEKSFTAPASSKYVPENAELVIHWKMNPSIIPNYVGNYQDKKNKSIVNKKTRLIRDSLFKLISLDFTKDISKWAGSHGSFAIFDRNNQSINDWLMILEIKQNINIEKELEIISSPNIINLSNKSSIKFNNSNSIRSQREINSNQTIYFTNEQGHVLISSNPKIITSSIKQFKNKTFSSKANYKNFQLKENINDGILLLEISPNRISKLIGQDENLLEINQTDKLISSLNIDKKNLMFEGVLFYKTKNKSQINNSSLNLINFNRELKLIDNFISINNPKEYFVNNSTHPYKSLIVSFIQKLLAENNSNLFQIILQNTDGNVLLLKNKDWLALTKKNYTQKNEITDLIKKEKFSNSNIDFKNKSLEVWSKLSTRENEKYQLNENIKAIIEENEGRYIWGQKLESIADLDDQEYLDKDYNSENLIDKIDDFDNILQIHLGKKKTKEFLNDFYPYILFKTMLGNKVNPPSSIDISIAIPTVNYPDFIKFEINLKTS